MAELFEKDKKLEIMRENDDIWRFICREKYYLEFEIEGQATYGQVTSNLCSGPEFVKV